MPLTRTLIIIEDDMEMSELLAAHVAPLGLAIGRAANGAEGLRLARGAENPIVILDHGLPDTSAAEVAAELSVEPAIPFVVVTAQDDMAIVEDMLERGARDYVVKDRALFARLPIVLRRVIVDLEREARLGLAEAELRESRELLTTFLDAIPLGVIIFRGDGHQKLINRTALRMYGIGPDAVQGHLTELLPQTELRREDASPYPLDELPLFRALRGEEAHADDIVMSFAGSTRPIEAWATPILDESGHVQYALTAFADVSVRKEAEAEVRALNASLAKVVLSRTSELEATTGALRTSERRARALFDQSTQLMMLLTPTGTVLEVNRALRETLGGGELVGKRLVELLTPSAFGDVPSPDALRDLLARCVGAGELVEFDAVLRDWEGELIAHRRIELQRVFGDGGDVELVFGVAVDLTKLERAREELARAWRMAEAASVAKSEFLANMSHEIRTPMNAILGFAELFEADQTLGPEQHENARTIHAAGESLLTLLDEVLEMAKIEAGRTELQPELFSPRSMLLELERLYRPAALQGGLQIDVAPTATRALVRTDPVVLRQILLHLIGNAIKFTTQGGVILDATLVHHEQLTVLEVSVTDTGRGIASAELTRIFDPFEQTKSTRRTVGGTGLGLTIALRLSLLLEGMLEAESEVGQGSRFIVSIPVEEVDMERPASVRPSDLASRLGADPERVSMSLDSVGPSARAAMRAALRIGDAARLKELLAELGDEASVAALHRLVDDYDYDALTSLLGD